MATRTTKRTTYRVCPQCRGAGTMVDRACSVWTGEDRDRDPDGFAAMLEGDYDVPCDRCGGLRVVTAASEREHAERRADHCTELREMGIHPGSPDYF